MKIIDQASKPNPRLERWFHLPEAVFNQIQMGVAIFDRSLTLQQCNQAWIELLSPNRSISASQWVPEGKLFDLLGDSREAIRPLIEQLLAGQTIQQKAFPIEYDSAIFYYDLVLAPITKDGDQTFVAIITEATSQVSSQRAKLENQQLVRQATLAERGRLAQELHDNIAQALGYVNLKLSATQQILSPEENSQIQTNIQEIKQLVGEIYTDVREEIFNLNATRSMGLNFLETLKEYITKYKEHYNLTVELVIDVEEAWLDFEGYVSTQIIRIIQEALMNVRKHAGVNRALIRFKEEEGLIRISIEDSGDGFEPDSVNRTGRSGFGLQIMEDRAKAVGGRLELQAVSGGEVRVIIWIDTAVAIGK